MSLPSARDWAVRTLVSGREQVDLVLGLGDGQTWAGRGRKRLERRAVDALRGALQMALIADDLGLRASVRHELARLGRDGRGHRVLHVEPRHGVRRKTAGRGSKPSWAVVAGQENVSGDDGLAGGQS